MLNNKHKNNNNINVSKSNGDPSQSHDNKNPRVFFDLEIGSRSIGRLVFELYASVVPKTVENFRALCTGEQGTNIISGTKLTFKDSCFHRIIPGFMAQAGDITHGNGSGGESIYGKTFADENFALKHNSAGLLSMANSGPHTNGSQFFITFKPTPHLDGRHVVFGRVVEGERLLLILEGVATDQTDRPKLPVMIVNCGQLSTEGNSTDDSGGVETVDSIAATTAAAESESFIPASFSARGSRRYQSAVTAASVDKVEKGKDVSSDTGTEAAVELEQQQEEKEEQPQEDTSKMTAMQKRLFALKMKMNSARKSNRSEVENEFRRQTDPHKYEYQQHQEQARGHKYSSQGGDNSGSNTISGDTGGDGGESDKDYYSRRLEAKGLTPSESYMLEPAQSAQRVKDRQEKKQIHEATFGLAALSRAGDFHSYEKSLARLPRKHEEDDEVTNGGAGANLLNYGNSNGNSSSSSGNLNSTSGVSAAGLDRLTKDIEERDARRRKHSGRRHRDTADAAGVDSINSANEFFNKKLKRSFDKYTVEIRQNLERGTAI